MLASYHAVDWYWQCPYMYFTSVYNWYVLLDVDDQLAGYVLLDVDEIEARAEKLSTQIYTIHKTDIMWNEKAFISLMHFDNDGTYSFQRL